MHVCGECEKPVAVVDGEIVRVCGHDQAPVFARMVATCEGRGGVK